MYRCKCCRSDFSVTSGTSLGHNRLGLSLLLGAVELQAASIARGEGRLRIIDFMHALGVYPNSARRLHRILKDVPMPRTTWTPSAKELEDQILRHLCQVTPEAFKAHWKRIAEREARQARLAK